MRHRIASESDTAPVRREGKLLERLILALGAVVLALWLAFLAWVAYRIGLWIL